MVPPEVLPTPAFKPEDSEVVSSSSFEPAARKEADPANWRRSLPLGLRDSELIHFAFQPAADAHPPRIRAIVHTHSALGRLLIDDYPGQNRFIYSADHLVVTSANEVQLNAARARMNRAAVRHRAPRVNAGLSYVALSASTPETIDRELARLTKLLGSEVTVELDGVGAAGGVPNDPSYGEQWHHKRIDAELAWDLTQGRRAVVVAVLDTGLNLELAEFENRVRPGGWDFVNDDGDPSDDHGHGTAVAGVVAANGNNELLVAGVDWRCRVFPVKILDERNLGLYSWWAQGIHHSIANGVEVINLSAGGSGTSQTLINAIDEAIESGIIFVTITQNNGRNGVSFPGNLPQSITVGATERDDVKTSFSNWGPEIDLVAPGRDIGTVSRSGTLNRWWGTSFSAPQVAGAASLLLSLNPTLDQAAMEALLTAGAEDRVGDENDTPGFDDHYGWGILNIYNSLLLSKTELQIEGDLNGHVRLSWLPSRNAASRRPYRIEWSDDLIAWQTIDNPKLRLQEGVEWVDNGTETGSLPRNGEDRFYRVRISPN